MLICRREAEQLAKGSAEAAQQTKTGQPRGHADMACNVQAGPGHKQINADSDLCRLICAAGDGV